MPLGEPEKLHQWTSSASEPSSPNASPTTRQRSAKGNTRSLYPSDRRRRMVGMDTERLEAYLSEGLSTPQIAELVGRSRSSVGYWVAKLGLRQPLKPGRKGDPE